MEDELFDLMFSKLQIDINDKTCDHNEIINNICDNCGKIFEPLNFDCERFYGSTDTRNSNDPSRCNKTRLIIENPRYILDTYNFDIPKEKDIKNYAENLYDQKNTKILRNTNILCIKYRCLLEACEFYDVKIPPEYIASKMGLSKHLISKSSKLYTNNISKTNGYELSVNDLIKYYFLCLYKNNELDINNMYINDIIILYTYCKQKDYIFPKSESKSLAYTFIYWYLIYKKLKLNNECINIKIYSSIIKLSCITINKILIVINKIINKAILKHHITNNDLIQKLYDINQIKINN